MRIEAVVINASPLITLFRSGQADLLPGLFTRIVVPEAVWQEVTVDEREDRAARELGQQSWPIREHVPSSPRVAAWNLGAGETAVLSHALAHPPLRAVIDDMDARRCAQTLGIPMLGTGGFWCWRSVAACWPPSARGSPSSGNRGFGYPMTSRGFCKIRRASERGGFSPEEAERFSQLLQQRVKGAGFFKTLLTHPAVSRPWLELGCILFSQYYDTVRWVGDELARRPEFAGLDIGLYAGSHRSGWWRDGTFQRCDRNVLKERVRAGDLKLLLGTDAASEGLNLQRLGTLINIDLPWNPTRLEQRKGRIQRIGQARDEVWIANLRYRDSVEDRVHQVLADRCRSCCRGDGDALDRIASFVTADPAAMPTASDASHCTAAIAQLDLWLD